MNTEQIMTLALTESDNYSALQAAIKVLVQERDELKANLHQVSLSHTHLHEENKVLRDALAEINAQAPVATKLETKQFDCFHVSAEDAKRLQELPVGTKLYTRKES